MGNVAARMIVAAAMVACLTLASNAAEPRIKPSDEIVVLRDTALKVGTETVAKVRKGAKLTIERVHGKWLWVRVGETRGWIHVRHVDRPHTPENEMGLKGGAETKKQIIVEGFLFDIDGFRLDGAQDEDAILLLSRAAQDDTQIIVEGDPLETLVRGPVPARAAPPGVANAPTRRAGVPKPRSVLWVEPPVVWVEPGPREGTIRIITDTSRVPADGIGKLGLMRETLPKLKLQWKLYLDKRLVGRAALLSTLFSPGTVIWGAAEGPVRLGSEMRELLRGYVVGKEAYRPLYPLTYDLWDQEKRATIDTELEKRWPELKGLSEKERRTFVVKVFEVLSPERNSQDYATNFVRRLRALGAFVQLNDRGEVRSVNLVGKVLADDLMVQLASLTELEVLWLGGTNVTNTNLKSIAQLRMLRRLSLQRTDITDAGLQHLTGLTALRDLDLTSTKVTDAGLARLEGLLPNVTISK